MICKETILKNLVMTLNFLVLGAGLQGSAAASILSRTEYASKVYLVDIDREMLDKVSKKIDSGKLHTIHGDVTNLEIGDEIDVVLNFLPPMLNDVALELALNLKAIYVDTASGPDKKLNPIDVNVLKTYEYRDRFRDEGVAAIVSSGATPGLTNWMARILYDELDGANKIRFIAGGYSLKMPLLFQPIAPYMDMFFASWSVETAFLYRATPPVVYDGRYKRMERFARPKYIDYGEPIGKLLTVLVEHEETVTLPIHLKVDYVEYRNPPDYLAYALIEYGFADMDKEVEVDGVKVNPYKVLKKLFPRPTNHFLHDRYEDEPKEMHIERLIVEAERDGIKLKATLDLDIPPRDTQTRKEFYKSFGTTYIYVALPAIASGIYAYENKLKGVYAPEAFNPQEYNKILEKLNYKPKIKIEGNQG